MAKRWSCRAGWAMGLLLCLSLQTSAQDNDARLAGTVRSQSGARLGLVSVLVDDPASGVRRTLQTDSEGHYHAPGLPPGNYRVTVSLSGFFTQVREGVELATGQVAEANFLLEPTGEASAPEAPTAGSAPAGVIDESQLVGLPMNGRSYTQLATLVAGVSDPTGGGRQGGTGSSITVSGGRGEWNSFLMDGTDINGTDNRVPRSAAGGQLGADAVLQVQIFSANYGAQYGRAAGGVMNAITRSGSNEWHGGLFEFFRNSKLDARNFFDPSEPPPFKRNQFGATVTGPIVQDKTFFMASFETLLNRLTETIVLFVPDNEARLRAVPSVAPYANLYLPAQFPVLREGKPTGVAENRSPATQPTDEYFFVARVDRQLGDRDALFARYTFDDATQTSVGTSPMFPTVTESRQQYVTLTETHFFSPALISTARLSYTRPVTQFRMEPAVEIPRSLFYVPSSPQIGNLLVPGLTILGPNPQAPWARVLNSYQVGEDVIYSHGAHTWKAGMLMERFQWNVFDSMSKGARWAFSSLDDFLQGGPEGTALLVALPGSDSYRHFRQTLLGFYLQDDYKVLPELTLNLGLRYEFTTMIHDRQGRTVHLVDELRDSEPQVGPPMKRNPSLLNFAPRIGLSWSPGNDPSMVIRAGVGIFHNQIIEYSVDGLRNTAPFYNVVVLPNTDTSGRIPNSPAFPDAVAVAGDAKASQLRIFEYNDPKTPTVYRYSLSLEKELFPGLRVGATYVGARGNHLLRTIETNQFPFPERQPDGRLFFPKDPDPDPRLGPDNSMNPAFGSIQKVLTDAQSFYNSFVVSVNRRPWRGLTLGANYTYSKSVDDASSVGGGLGGAPQQYGLDRKLDRALSSFDIRHRFSLRYFYSLPFGSGRRWLDSGWLAHLLGGWRVGGILRTRTGQTADVRYSIPAEGFLFVSQRPDLKPGHSNNPTKGVTAGCEGVEAGQELGGPDLYFDPCVFEPPEPGFIGNAGRLILIGPRVVNMDFSLQKEFAIDSQRRLQFRAEFFNLPNHTNFRPPQRGSASVFRGAGGIVNPSAGRLRSTATTPRQIQFALRLSF